MHSKRRMASHPSPSSEPKRQPSKGAAIVEKYRPKLNALSDARREQYFNQGMQMIYGGSSKAKVRSA